jgi:hypothetical protein
MVQWLRALAALAEDLDSVSRTHMLANDHVQLQFQRIQCPLLASDGTCMHVIHKHTLRPNTHTHKMKIKESLKSLHAPENPIGLCKGAPGDT